MNLENAELLTEEGRLLQQIQGDDNDIDGKRIRDRCSGGERERQRDRKRYIEGEKERET